MKKKQSNTPGRNPFQEKALKDQSPHWSKDEPQPASEEIPAALAPHAPVAPALTGQPTTTEAAEGVSGQPEPAFEDEPAGQ